MKSPANMNIIQIDITNACPKRCSNCTRFCGHHTKPFWMDFDTFTKAVDSMKGFHGILGIMGGEPTIHPEFDKFIRYYRDNWGFDEPAVRLSEPVPDFMQHVLNNYSDTHHHNQRGLFTNVSPKYYEHFELIQDTFGYQLVNDHSNPSMHETLMATRKELGIPDDEWIKLRDKCWVQNLWSASITPKGSFFCEVAAAMDMTLNGPGGWPIEPGWWKRKPCDFGDQLQWCELCSAALPMPKRNANEEIDDISPVWREKLVQIESPKMKKGLVAEFAPRTYDPKAHTVIENIQPYLDNPTSRIGSARDTLRPQCISTVVWIGAGIAEARAGQLLDEMKQTGRLDVVIYENDAVARLAEARNVAAVSATEWCAGLTREQMRARLKMKDWVVLTRDAAAPEFFWQAVKDCVFNPGTYHEFGTGCFFNLRAASFRKTAAPAKLAVQYPGDKQTRITKRSFLPRKKSFKVLVSRHLLNRMRRLRSSLAILKSGTGRWNP